MSGRNVRAWVVATILLCAMAAAGTPPMRFSYQGRLADNAGLPLQGNHTLFFTLWSGGSSSVASSGTKVFQEQVTLNLSNGTVSHAVGSGTAQTLGPLSKSMLQAPGDLYLQVAVTAAGNVILPRTRIESVPYALVSADGEVRTPIHPTTSLPIVISQPGSYYLTGNVYGVANADGINITTDGVTLDLMGFELVGVEGSREGIDADGISLKNLTVRNGIIRNWGRSGISCSVISSCRFEDLLCSNNEENGLEAGHGSLVRNCVSHSNGQAGIRCAAGSNVEDCVARENEGDGIQVLMGTILDCTARGNFGNGIVAQTGTTVRNCVADSNQIDGIVAGKGGQVIGSAARNNQGDGIEAGASNSIIRENSCTDNGTAETNGAGILIGSVNNRVEGNSCVDNVGGIRVTSAGNFITRNTCSNNTTNFHIVAGNVFLAVLANVTGGTVNGDSGGVSPGSADPNANFTF